MTKVREAKKEFSDALLELGRSRSLYTVFEDFLDYSLLMLRWWDRKPEYFKTLEEKYTSKREWQLFSQAYFSMITVANNGGELFNDPFADFYEEHLVKKRLGQFFTPQCVSDLMAQLLDLEPASPGTTMYEPACGSGSTILAAARKNPQLTIFAADKDIICCKMVVIIFMLNRLTGEVAWMNSLSLEHWKSWHHINVVTEEGDILPHFTETGPGETRLLKKMMQPDDENNENTQEDNPVPVPDLRSEE